jgi:hypothetical protein
MSNFDDYTTLLTGGARKKKSTTDDGKKTKKGKMTYEDRLKNLEKARAVRMANLGKKSMKGKGNYTQDYVDESQVNYAGSPLDMYYLGSEKQHEMEKQERGEIDDKKLSKKDKMKIDKILGGRMKSTKTAMKIKSKKEIEDEMDDIDGGAIAMKYDIPEAIKVLAELASKFGLKLMR